jgi:hypothetical protein
MKCSLREPDITTDARAYPAATSRLATGRYCSHGFPFLGAGASHTLLSFLAEELYHNDHGPRKAARDEMLDHPLGRGVRWGYSAPPGVAGFFLK